jgi:hypothetical protein
MTTFAAFAFAFVALCSPAFADPAPARPASLALRLVVNAGGAPRSYDVLVTTDHRCAMASQKRADHEDNITVCTSDEGRLDIEWWMRDAATEYHSKDSVVLARGASAELGSSNGPRLTVTVQ